MSETLGAGSKFWRWDADTSAYVEVSDVINISGPGLSRDVMDNTKLSTTDGYKAVRSGMRDGGTLTFTMDFVRANYLLLKADFESDAMQYYKVSVADTEGTEWEFEGLVTSLPVNIPGAGEKITCDVGITISGQVVMDNESSLVV